MYVNCRLQARARLIPGIVIFLQKLWRGAICRRRYRKLLAARTILAAYRRYKVRTYLASLPPNLYRGTTDAAAVARLAPWPPPAKCIAPLVARWRAAYERWRAWLVIRAIPNQDWPQLRNKVVHFH